jgi:hypothetical protein
MGGKVMIKYEMLFENRAVLVLTRPFEFSLTEKCPFCKRNHYHGEGDGYRVPHCPEGKAKEFVVADDGTKLYQIDGYFIKTEAK